MRTLSRDCGSWITASPTPYSGTKAHQSANVVGYHDHTFQNATVTMPVAVGDILATDALVKQTGRWRVVSRHITGPRYGRMSN